MEAKKENRGGKRPNSGRKKADYKTTVVSFRVKEELAPKINELVNHYLESLKP